MMRDEEHDKQDRGAQTLVTVSPPFQKPSDAPETVRVRSSRGIQTEAHLEPDDSIEQIEDILKYTPYVNITQDAVRVTDLPKKFVLKFDDYIAEEDIDTFDENSSFDASDVAAVRPGSYIGKSNLRQREEMSQELPQPVDAECQTFIMVRPMFLELDDVATVLCNLQVQTSRTFTPNASMEQVNKDLHLYYYHNAGSVELMHTNSPPDQTKSRTDRKAITADQIEHMCKDDCPEEEVLENVKEWYDDVGRLIREVDYEEGTDGITGENVGGIEAQIIATVDMTADTLQVQAERMTSRYCKTEKQDFEVQCIEFADHLEPGECTGGKARDKSCTCDCQLYSKDADRGGVEPDFNICAKKLEELCKLVAGGYGGLILGEVSSSPALMGCPCENQASSDLANKRAKTELPLKARACTNRKCNCLYSKGCLHCEQALKTEAKMAANDLTKLQTCKKFKASQNIEFLTEVDGEYADAYLDLLDGDEAYTQTEFGEEYFATPAALVIPAPPCSCLTNVEMPWDMLLIPPTPKKRPEVPPVESIMETLPDVVRAQLKELTVLPITEEQLLALTREFLEDNIGNTEDIDEIQRQIMAEKARIDAEVAAAEAEEHQEEAEEVSDEEDDEYHPCRPRPPLRSFQVFEPECEIYNEPYLDRLWRTFFCEDEMEVGPCTSHVEMPWNHIELAKTIVIRKGHHPCDAKPKMKTKVEKDPYRKCGPEYREKLRRQHALFGSDLNSVCGIEACKASRSKKGASNPDVNRSMDDCICKPCASMSEPEMSLKKGLTDSCICPSTPPRPPGPPNESCADSSAVSCLGKDSDIVSCIKGKGKGKGKGRGKTSASLPTISQPTDSCICPGGPATCMGAKGKDKEPGTEPKAPQSRTERIAALLDSCKKEMEPIKDGINQLRARIKELNIPDLMAYQEPPQHPGIGGSGVGGIGVGPSSPGLGGYMGGNMGMQMPPMCYPPPMMCYPFPPSMMYPPGGAGAGAASANAQVSRLPPGNAGYGQPAKSQSSSKKCKCKSKRKRYPSSSYNTSSESLTGSTDYEDNRRKKGKKSPRSRSRSRLLCSCKPQESKTVICPSIHQQSMQDKPSVGSAEVDASAPASKRPSSCESSLCTVPSSASKISKTPTVKSMIPRLVSKSCANKPGTICPNASLVTQKTSGFKSCLSCVSQRSSTKVIEPGDPKEPPKPSTPEAVQPVQPKSKDSMCAHCSSLIMVESCATQNTCDYSTCPTSLATVNTQKSILKPTSAASTQSTSCKIRFRDKSKRGKCSRCNASKYKPEMVEAAVEVKRGRPVTESSEELSCKSLCKPCRSRNA